MSACAPAGLVVTTSVPVVTARGVGARYRRAVNTPPDASATSAAAPAAITRQFGPCGDGACQPAFGIDTVAAGGWCSSSSSISGAASGAASGATTGLSGGGGTGIGPGACLGTRTGNAP